MAKKVNRVLFNQTFFDSGLPKYVAGMHYPSNDDTQRQVTVGIATAIQVDPDEAQQMDLQLARDPAADADLQAANS